MKRRRILLALIVVALFAMFSTNLFGTTAEASAWTVRTEYPNSSSTAWKYYSAPLNTFPLSPYNSGNCTWYAYGRAYEVFGKDCGLRGAGDAGNWYSYAIAQNMSVGSVPRAGAIICWSTHVGFVESVEGSTVTWTESNYQFNSSSPVSNFKKYSSTHPETYCSAYGGKLLGYIYLDGTSTHTHDYNEYVYYWASHPHYKCYKCACGDVKENTAETVYIETCELCNPPAAPEAVKITQQPENVVVSSGKTAKVSVKATGDGLTYTWYYAKKGSSKFTKTAVTTASYSVKMSSSVNGRKVYCVITDRYGNSVTSSTVTLYKGTAAKITTQPKGVTVASGKTGKLTVKASGSGLSYTWYAKNEGADDFTKVSSSGKTYSFKMTAKLDGAQVYCVVKDKYGITVKSSVVTVKLAPQPEITTQPKSVTQVSGQTVKFTVKASGDGLKYQWYYAKKGSSSFKKLSGKTSATCSVKVSSSVNGRKYYCKVTDKYGQTVKSSAVTLTMKTVAKITTQPKSVSVFEGKTATFTVKATGDGLNYTWYYAETNGTEWVETSTNTNAFSKKASASLNGYKFLCVVQDKYGNQVKSKTVTLTVKSTAKITQQPAAVSAVNGSTAKVTVKATGDGLTYTWYYAKKGSSKFTKTTVTTASYSVKMSSSVDGRKVYCVVKDKYGNQVKSSVVTLSMQSDTFKEVVGYWGSYEFTAAGGKTTDWYEDVMDIAEDGTVSMLYDSVYQEKYTLEYIGKTDYKYYYRMHRGSENIDVTYYVLSENLELTYEDGSIMMFAR